MVQPLEVTPVVLKEQAEEPLAGSPGERLSRSIEQVIHSFEPRINDTLPRTQQHPSFVQTHISRQQGEPSSTVSHAGSYPQVVWPAYPDVEFPAAPAWNPVPAESASSPQARIPAHEGKKSHNFAIVILIMAIVPILVGLLIVANIMPGHPGGFANSTLVTPLPTTIRTQLPQTTSTPVITGTLVPGSPEVLVPSTGVWVRVLYSGTYRGLIGTLGNQLEVTDTGDHLYQIPSSERTVAAALQKKDGSGDQILLEVYKDGVMLKRETSTTPKGIVEIQLDLETRPNAGNSTPFE
jgi:hypothetical protein